MVEVRIKEPGRVADLSIAGGCPSCGGSLEARATSTLVWTYCPDCHRIAKSVLGYTPGGIKVAHPYVAA